MDIDTFFNVNKGNWISQKTSYNPNLKNHTTIKGKVCIEKNVITSMIAKQTLPINTIEENNLKTFNINWGQAKNQRHTVVIALEHQHTKQNCKGKVYKYDQNSERKILEGTCQFKNDILTLNLTNGEFEAEERIWFVNSNVKLTNSVIKRKKECILLSFSSEIKIEPNT
nr:Ycf58 [Erythrocladia irregularis]